MVNRLKIVGVMGSGEERHEDLSVPLGRRLALLGVNLLTGGGKGVMEAVSEGFVAVKERGGLSIGVLPGRVDHPMARGCHRLIREGCRLVEDPGEVLAHLAHPELPFDPVPDRPGSGPRGHTWDGPRDSVEAALVGETCTVDELCARLDRSPTAVLGRLTELELDGRVVRSPGGLWRLAQGGG